MRGVLCRTLAPAAAALVVRKSFQTDPKMNPIQSKTLMAVCAVSCGLSTLVPATEIVADFNDMNLGDMRSNNQPPGTGVGFTGDHWVAGTGTQLIGNGDLMVATTGYNVVQPAVNPRKMYTNNTLARQQGRDCKDLAGNNIWMSFLAVKPTTAGVVGVGFNNSLAAGALGYTPADPRLVWQGDAVQFSVGNAVVGTTPLTSTTSTVLIIARVQINAGGAGEDFLDVWVNPANVSNLGAMGAASFSVTGSNWITGGVISSIHPHCYAATGTSTPNLDCLMLSDEADALAFVTGNALDPDPWLVESGSTDPDYVFGLLDEDTVNTPVYPVTRSRTFDNLGATQPITITGVTLSGDVAGVFSVATTPAIGSGLVLAPGASLTVDITFDNPAAAGAFSGMVQITTSVPEQNLVYPVSASYVRTGDEVVGNGTFEDPDFDRYWASNPATPTAVTPFGGLAPGSATAAKITSGYFQQDFTPGVGDDFEISFYFAVQQVAAAAGNRNFSLFLRDASGAGNYINLGHFPSGATTTLTTPGFYINNGTTWVPVIFNNGVPGSGSQVTISHSLDALADGDFDDAGDGDVKNVYQMRIVGAEYGGISYNYRINLYDAAGNLLGWSDKITQKQSGNPSAEQPRRLVFSTEFGGNQGFVVDDVSVLAVEDDGFGNTKVTDPDLQVLKNPVFAAMFSPAGGSSADLVIRNSGTAALSISAVNFSDPHFSLNGALPGPIAAGGLATLKIDFNPGVDRGRFPCTIRIGSNDSLDALLGEPETVETRAAAWETGGVVTTNGNFEATPFDSGWINVGATLAGGLGGAQAAYIPTGGSGVAQDVESLPDWEFECSFAVRDSDARQFSLGVTTDSAGGATGWQALNLKYGENNVDAWRVYNGTAWVEIPVVNGTLGTILPSVDGDADNSLDNPGGGDVAKVYKLKIVGHNWGAGAGMASYDLFLSEPNGTTYTRAATDLRIFQTAAPDLLVPTGIRFDTQYGLNPGFWVDDVSFKATLPAMDDPNLMVDVVPSWPNLVGVATQKSDLVVSNAGAAGALRITGITFSGAAAANFSVDPSVSFPVVIAAGSAATIPIVFDKLGGGGVFQAMLKIASDDETDAALGLTRDLGLMATAFEYGNKVLTNWGFEATPFSTHWTIVEPLPGDVKVNGGLNTGGGSTQCAFLSTINDRLFQSPALAMENFTIEFYFALTTTTGRSLNFRVFPNAAATGTEIVTFKIDGGALWTYSGSWQSIIPGLSLASSLDFNGDGILDPVGSDPNDVRNVYRIRLRGRNFGTEAAEYDVAVLAENGTPLGSAMGQTIWQLPTPATSNRAWAVEFNTASGATPFRVDDVSYTLDSPVAGGDYGDWADSIPGFVETDPGQDPDGDGLDNQTEYAFGLNPMDGGSVSPVGVPLDKASGTFSYTRRNPATLETGLSYTYHYSTTLDGGWTPFTPLEESSDDGDPVETVTIKVPAVLLGDKLFVRVQAK
jgi:hypothetical protein